MPESLVRIEFYGFIALAAWLVFYQFRDSRRRAREFEAEQRARDAEGEAGPPA